MNPEDIGLLLIAGSIVGTHLYLSVWVESRRISKGGK